MKIVQILYANNVHRKKNTMANAILALHNHTM